MKQKVLGATLVLSAPVNSFASYNGKGDKLDLSKLDNIDAFKNLIIKDKSNADKNLKDLLIDGKENTKAETITADAFKKDDFSVVLSIETKDENKSKVDNAYKIGTETDGKKLKLEAVSDKKKLEPGTYLISTWSDDGKKIKFEKKKFDEKQALDNEGKSYKKDEGK